MSSFERGPERGPEREKTCPDCQGKGSKNGKTCDRCGDRGAIPAS